MDKDALLKEVVEIMSNVLDLDTASLNWDSTSESVIGWDSLAHIIIIGLIEEEFGMKFSLTDMAGFSSLGKIVEAVQAKI